ncbi:MAG: flavin-containing monooxygenase [Verrucomicrobiota bacterium]
MRIRTTGTVIVGAGQAGLALSHYLSRVRLEHVVLDRGRIGERWRSERWESLRLLTPNWLNRLPGSAPHADRNGFLGGSAFATYLEDYARSFSAPVREGVSVLEVARGRHGFAVGTDSGTWRAKNVVIATGYADEPRLPAAAAAAPGRILQLHSSRYRSADRLPPGGVLIVGSGPSGQQLAAELRRSGRDVTLAAGRHARSPRRYRGRDVWSWFAETGRLDQTLEDVPHERDPASSPSLVLSGANGGEHLDLSMLAALGVVVAGRLKGFTGRYALFADDLEPTVREADERMSRMLARIDGRVAGSRTVDPPAAEPVPAQTLPRGPRMLDLERTNISTLIWATGYRRSYSWLNVDVLDDDGEVAHDRGVTAVPGLYALGLRFQHRRSSHFIGGVGHDACFLAARLLTPPGCGTTVCGSRAASASPAGVVTLAR